jgi:hypothetical protein
VLLGAPDRVVGLTRKVCLLSVTLLRVTAIVIHEANC